DLRSHAQRGPGGHFRFGDPRSVHDSAVGGGEVLHPDASLARVQAAVETGDEAVLQHHLVLRMCAHRDGSSVEPYPLDGAIPATPPQDEGTRRGGLQAYERGHPSGRRFGDQLQGAGDLRHALPPELPPCIPVPWGGANRIPDRARTLEARYPAGVRPCIAVLLPQSSYRGDDLLAAAARVGVDLFVASDRCHVLAEEWTEGSLPLDFTDPDGAARSLAEAVRPRKPVAVLGTDDQTAVIAARAARLLGLPHDAPEAVEAARNKRLSRERLRTAGVPVPRFQVMPLGGAIPDGLPFPCVVKPLV